MSASVASSGFPEYRVHSALNRECLPSTHRDPDRKIAWLNAVCLSVLTVGVLMTKEPARLAFTPLRYEAPQRIVIVEPVLLKPEESAELKPEDIPDTPEAAPVAVVVVAADPTKVPFAVPVIGATSASTDLRQVTASPPLYAPPKAPPTTILRIGERSSKGDLPWPTEKDYPPEAVIRRETGDVVLVVETTAEGGRPAEVTIEQSSGSSYLDLHARNWVLNKWKFFPAEPKRWKFMFSYGLPGVSR